MTDEKRPKRTRKPARPADDQTPHRPTAELPAADDPLRVAYRHATDPGEPPPHLTDPPQLAHLLEGRAAADAGEPAARSPNPFAVRADYQAGVHLLEDRKYRQVQLRFDAKPADSVRQAMAEGGFRWRGAEGVWTKQLEAGAEWRTRADANALFDRVTALIREHHLPADLPPGPARGRP